MWIQCWLPAILANKLLSAFSAITSIVWTDVQNPYLNARLRNALGLIWPFNSADRKPWYYRPTSISCDIYELYFATAGSQTIKHTVKYTKYTFADRRTSRRIADMLLMGGAIRQHSASCHVTAISYVYSARKTSSFFRMSYCLKHSLRTHDKKCHHRNHPK